MQTIPVEWWMGQGVLGVILMLTGFLVWRVVSWARVKVAEPVVDAHLKLIATLNEHIPKQTDAINQQGMILRERSVRFDKIIENEDKIIEKLDHPAKDK